jgi:hypothetical protein
VIINLLENQDIPYSKKNPEAFIELANQTIKSLNPQGLAELYVDLGLLEVFIKDITEQHWIQEKKEKKLITNFESFIKPFLKSTLAPSLYYHAFLKASSVVELKVVSNKIGIIEGNILKRIKVNDFAEQKMFVKKVLELTTELFELENNVMSEYLANNKDMGLSLYRTFDGLDEIFGLNYSADHGMKTVMTNTERLYEGAGVGVQSGYSTILMALRHLQLTPGMRVIDLGSGYGRVGLVLGVLHPDVNFVGYEYVPHRVEISNTTVQNFGLQSCVQFLAQDLSSAEFQVPDADVYYLYDPFSEETYRYVLSQLVAISERKKIIIVTKGNARKWLDEIAGVMHWPQPKVYHTGNLCLYSSR